MSLAFFAILFSGKGGENDADGIFFESKVELFTEQTKC